MNSYIKNRIIDEANYMLNHDATVREIAKVFNVSKSTIDNDFLKKLCDIDETLYNDVKSVLDRHWEFKHINGGEATRNKYINGVNVKC